MKNFTAWAVFFLTALIVSLTVVGSVNADGISGAAGCIPVYGGGVQCPRPPELLLDKTVQNPATGAFVDNLGPNDPKYRPQQIITFHVVVKNPGEQALSSVSVADTLPLYVDFMTGPGKYDPKARTLTWTVTNLLGGASQLFEIRGRIQHTALLPETNLICPNKGSSQPVNVVEARGDSLTDRDESQFCIEKELVVPSVPAAGPEHWMYSIIGLGAALLNGLYFRRKSQLTIKS